MEELIFTQKELYERYQRWMKKAAVATSFPSSMEYKPDYDVCASPPYSYAKFHRFTRYIHETYGEKNARAYTDAVIHYQTKLRQSFELQPADPPAGKLLTKTEGLKFKTDSFEMAWMSARFGVFWIPDVDVDNCQVCIAAFTFLTRKHHCRMCGRVVCDNCSRGRRTVSNSPSSERACKDCCMEVVDPQHCCDHEPPPYQALQYSAPTHLDQQCASAPPLDCVEKERCASPPPPSQQQQLPPPQQFYQPQVAPSYYMQTQPLPPQQPQQYYQPKLAPPPQLPPPPTQVHSPPPPPQAPQQVQIQQPPPQQPPPQQPPPQPYDPSAPVMYQTGNAVPYNPPNSQQYSNLYALLDPKNK